MTNVTLRSRFSAWNRGFFRWWTMTNDDLYERHLAITREKLHRIWNRPCPQPSPSAVGQHFCPLCKNWIDCKNAFCQDAIDFIQGERR